MLQTGNEKAYNVQEAAKLLKLTPATVRNYIKAGKTKAQKVGTLPYSRKQLADVYKGGVNK